MAEIAHSQRLLRVRLVCRGCKFRPFSHANSPRLSLVCDYAWRFWPIVSAFVFSQRLLPLSASLHNTPGALKEERKTEHIKTGVETKMETGWPLMKTHAEMEVHYRNGHEMMKGGGGMEGRHIMLRANHTRRL